jgi:hypothetical protein
MVSRSRCSQTQRTDAVRNGEPALAHLVNDADWFVKQGGREAFASALLLGPVQRSGIKRAKVPEFGIADQ